MRHNLPKIAIIGAGVNGLGIGWSLAKQGASVTIFEQASVGRGASWAAAGMLAAASEVEPQEEAVLGLHLHSQNLWKSFASELETASGMQIDYRAEGTLIVATERDEVEQLRFKYDYAKGLGLELEWLSGSEARALEPGLGPSARAAISAPQDHQVDNRKVTEALRKIALQAGVTLYEHTKAALDIANGRIKGVIADNLQHPADIVILAAGPWAYEIEGLPPHLLPPVRPVKGQALALRASPDFLNHVLWARGVYMVPRLDGRIIVGATVEEKGFDDSLTAGGMLTLLHSAWHLLPNIQELPISETWVGFRPGSPDDAPIFGESGIEGLIYACGHNRNGILLLPATIDAISGLIAKGSLPSFAASFTMKRFQSERIEKNRHVAFPA